MPKKSKYETHVRPYLDAVRSWRATGASLEDIAKNLHISKKTLCAYRGQHAELDEALSMALDLANARVSGALFRLATGYTIELEERTEGPRGVTVKHKQVHYPPDPRAIQIWLYNQDREHWRPERAMLAEADESNQAGGVIQIPALELGGYEQEREAEMERLRQEAGDNGDGGA